MSSFEAYAAKEQIVLAWVGQCMLIYSDIKEVLFRMREETEFMPPDESLKQGRNRSWLLQTRKFIITH